MRKIIFYSVLTFAMLPMWSMAQSRVEYTYDSAGNRLSQSVVYDEIDFQQYSLMGDSQSDIQGSTQSRQLGGHTVRVTTFSSTGQVRVEILGLGTSDNCLLTVYSLSGAQVVSQHVASTQTMVDLSFSPKGVYILLLRLNDESTSWKVIIK